MPVRTALAGAQTVGGTATSAYANSVAGGRIGYAETSTAQAVSAETDLTGLAVTVTIGANRAIRIEAHVPVGGYGAGTSGERGYVRIKEGTTEFSGDAVIENISSGIIINGTAKPSAISGHVDFPTPTAGAHTYKLTLQGLSTANANTSATTCPATTRPCYIAVYDDGPSF